MLNVNTANDTARWLFDDIAYQCDCGRYPYVISEENGLMPILEQVYCEITPECNNHCFTCGNVFQKHHINCNEFIYPPILTGDEWASIFRKIIPPAHHVIITGGEPTLHPQIFYIVDILDRSLTDFTIFTNGRWNNPTSVVETLSCKNHLKGLVISLHGPDSVSHEAFTGVPGSYSETIQNIGLAASTGIKVILSTVIHRYNADFIFKIFKLAKRIGAKGLCFNRLIGMKNNSLNSSPEQMLAALTDIVSLDDSELPVRIGATMPQCFFPSQWGICGAGASFVTIDPWGNVRPCNHAPLITGNILNDKFEAILHSEAMCRWRGFIPDGCRGCSSFFNCGGGCKAECFISREKMDFLAQQQFSCIA